MLTRFQIFFSFSKTSEAMQKLLKLNEFFFFPFFKERYFQGIFPEVLPPKLSPIFWMVLHEKLILPLLS